MGLPRCDPQLATGLDRPGLGCPRLPVGASCQRARGIGGGACAYFYSNRNISQPGLSSAQSLGRTGSNTETSSSPDPLHSSELERQLSPECGYLVTTVPISHTKEVRSPLQGSTTCAPSSNQSHPRPLWAVGLSPSWPMLSPYLYTNTQYPAQPSPQLSGNVRGTPAWEGKLCSHLLVLTCSVPRGSLCASQGVPQSAKLPNEEDAGRYFHR